MRIAMKVMSLPEDQQLLAAKEFFDAAVSDVQEARSNLAEAEQLLNELRRREGAKYLREIVSR